MIIGIESDSLQLKGFGIERYNRNLVESLLKIKPNDVDIYLFHTGKKYDLLYEGVHEITLPHLRPRRVFFNLSPLLLFHYKFDVLHYPTEALSPFFWMPSGRKIVTVHGGSWLGLPPDLCPAQPRSWKMALRYFNNKIDTVITISEFSKKAIMRGYKIPEERIKVIYHGVEHTSFKPFMGDIRNLKKYLSQKYKIETSYILNTTSTFQILKNVPNLLEAFYQLKKRGLKHKLVLIGKGGGLRCEEVTKTVRRLGLEREVIFTGFISEKDLPILYNAAELFVFPSLYEGFGLPILEAMASGCPVVTSNVSSLPEVAGNAAVLIDPYRVSELAEAMCKILCNSDLRRNLIMKGLERARLFTWEECAKKTLEVYLEGNDE